MRKAIIVWFTLLILMEVLLTVYGQGLGFQLRGPLSFGGFVAGEPVWTVGKFKVVTSDPTLHRRFQELEGQQLLITVERAPK